MNSVFIGKVVCTHGIKGELRILSDFTSKEKVFFVGSHIIIGNNSYEIRSYRVHKKYDMVTLDNFHDINEVLFLLRKSVFFDKKLLDLSENEVLDEDLITFDVLTDDGKKGIIKEIFQASEMNKVMRVMFDHEVLIPISSPMIKKIDKENCCVYVNLIDGM